jgi:hypothetical protein
LAVLILSFFGFFAPFHLSLLPTKNGKRKTKRGERRKEDEAGGEHIITPPFFYSATIYPTSNGW